MRHPTACLLVGLLMSACTASTPLPPAGSPLVRGTIVSIRHSATGSGFLVEPGDGTCGLQAVADDQTHVARRTASGETRTVGVGAEGVGTLTEGDRVEVYVDGPVRESCPLQAHATAIVVMPSADLGLRPQH